MGSTVELFQWDGRRGLLAQQQSVSTLPVNYRGVSTAAEIRVSIDGRFLYASNRGHNGITVFAISQQSGRLKPIQYVPTGGRTPRNFDFDPTEQWLLVTNQDSQNAQVFRVDRMIGKLTVAGQPVAYPVRSLLDSWVLDRRITD